MSKRIYIAATITVLSAPTYAAEGNVSIYGVTLGKPLLVKSCALVRRINPKADAYCADEQRSETFTAAKDHKMVTYYVYFPGLKAPSISAYSFFQVSVSDGLVQDILLFTKGAEAQSEALSLLTGRFGKPSQDEINTVTNGFGAKFDEVDATWRVDGNEIRFRGIAGKMNSGIINASSPEAALFDEERYRRLKASEPQF